MSAWRAATSARSTASVGSRRWLRTPRCENCLPRSTRRSAVGGNQILLQGGHNPDIPLSVVRGPLPRRQGELPDVQAARLRRPKSSHLHMSKLPVPEVLSRLIAAGLGSVPGGGGEILVDRVRKRCNCNGKATADEWLDVMREAHAPGGAHGTMMFGTHRDARGAGRAPDALRQLQDETAASPRSSGGPSSPNTPSSAGVGSTGFEYLRTLAIARMSSTTSPTSSRPG